MVNHPNRSKRNRNAEAYAASLPTVNGRLRAEAPAMLASLKRICREVETPEDLLSAIADAEALLRKIEG